MSRKGHTKKLSKTINLKGWKEIRGEEIPQLLYKAADKKSIKIGRARGFFITEKHYK